MILSNKGIGKLRFIPTSIHIGDSNMCGVTPTPSAVPYPYLGPYTNCLMYTKNNQDSIDDGSFLPLQQDVNQFSARPVSTVYGPTMACGYEWQRRAGRKVAMIKMSVSGSSLANQAPRSSYINGSWAMPQGDNYQLFRDYFYTPAVAKLAPLGYTPEVKAAFIRLGTNDANTSFYSADYFQSQIFILVKNLRALTGNPKLPIYWYKIREDLASLASSSFFVLANIQNLNRMIVNAAAILGNFTIIDTGTSSASMAADGVHFTSAAYDLQGLNEGLILSSL